MAAPSDLPTPGPESPRTQRKPYRFATLCATVENPDLKDQYGASSVPIYQTATFKGISGDFDYTRSGNPTRSHLGRFSDWVAYNETYVPNRSFLTILASTYQSTILQKCHPQSTLLLYHREWRQWTS